jgi:hypothetical protein
LMVLAHLRRMQCALNNHSIQRDKQAPNKM